MQPRPSFLHLSSRLLLILGGVFIVLGLLVFGRTLFYGFVELDDGLLIFENPAIHRISLSSLWTIFTTYDPELYIPLTLFSYQIDALLGGGYAITFHLTNVLLHTANAFLVALLCIRLLSNVRQEQEEWWIMGVGIFSGFLFLVHPLHTEAVVWASARKDLLSTLFFLLALHGYLRYIDAAVKKERWFIASVVLFTAGLMSKVSIIALPLTLFLVDDWFGRKLSAKILLEKLPFIAFAILFGVIAIFGKIDASSASISEQIVLGVRSSFFYLSKFLWPFHLSVLYPAPQGVQWTSLSFVAPLFAAFCIIAGTFLVRVKDPLGNRGFGKTVFFGVLFFAITLVPSFFNLATEMPRNIASNRYSYLPSIGFIFLISAGIVFVFSHFRTQGGRRGRRVIAVACAILLTACVIGTQYYLSVWKDNTSLAQHTVHLYPNSSVGQMWLGNALRDEGKPEEALKHYDAALQIHAEPIIHYNRALALEMLGRTSAAIASYEQSFDDPSQAPLAHINVGRIHHQAGDRSQAREHFAAAALQAPHLAMPFFNLGVLSTEEEKLEEAIELYAKALERDPLFAEARINLIIVLVNMKRLEEAELELKKMIALHPGDSRIPMLVGHLERAKTPQQ